MELKWKLLGLWWRLRGINPPFMARMIDLAPDAPRVGFAKTYETEYPYRPGWGTVVRLYGAHGVLLASLQPRVALDDDSIDARLLMALRATEGTSEWRAKAWDDGERVGELIFTHASSPEEAAEFSDMLGLDDEFTRVVSDKWPVDSEALQFADACGDITTREARQILDAERDA